MGMRFGRITKRSLQEETEETEFAFWFASVISCLPTTEGEAMRRIQERPVRKRMKPTPIFYRRKRRKQSLRFDSSPLSPLSPVCLLSDGHKVISAIASC